MVSHVEGEIVIHRPVEEVFDFVADERNEPHYNPRMLRAEKITDGPVGPGTRFLAELETMGHTMPMTVEFTNYDRPRRVTSCTRSSMMTTVGTLTFVPIADGTRMRWSWDVRPRGIRRVRRPACRLPRSTAGAEHLGQSEASPGTRWRGDVWTQTERCPGRAVSSGGPRPRRRGLVLSAISRIYAPICSVAVW